MNRSELKRQRSNARLVRVGRWLVIALFVVGVLHVIAKWMVTYG